MGLIFHFPVTGTLSYSRSDRGDSPPVQDVSLGELLAILSLPFWPVFRLAAKGADRILHRAYYRRAREDREMQEAYVARLRELSCAPVFDREAYYRAVRDFSDARDRIREQREREDLLCRNARARRGFAPFASDRALKGRAERRKRRDSAWLDWAKALAGWALRRVGAPPEPPLARPGRTLRKLCGGSLRPAPSPEALLSQYEKARGRGRVEEKIRLGSMLLDLEAAVDNGPVRNGEGVIVGRNPGLLGWLRENCRELAPHYAALQNCRRMAHAFRLRHGVGDPVPAELLLSPSPAEEARLPAPAAEALSAAREKARRWLRDWGGATAGAASDALWNGRPRGRRENGRSPGRKRPEKEPAERRVRLRKTE